MFGFAKKIYAWASQKANSRFAPLWLGVIFFLELFFILPMDSILLLFCLENPKRRYTYALLLQPLLSLVHLSGIISGWRPGTLCTLMF